jgi:hypothetical protein
MAKFKDDSVSLSGRAVNRITRDPRGWIEGPVLTPDGIVHCYAQGDEQNENHTRLDFVWQGRLYMRQFPKVRMTARGMATAAGRFAREVANG